MKRKTGRRLLGALLALAMAMGLMAGMGGTAYAADAYNIWVGGAQVTSENLSGSGWSYDAGTNTLTLDGYSYSGTGHSWVNGDEVTEYAMIYAAQALSINLKDTNSVSSATASDVLAYGVYTEGDLVITGSGALTASANADSGAGVFSRNLTINSGTINATGPFGIHSLDSFTVENGTVNATATGDGGVGIYAENDLTIEDGSVKAECTGEQGYAVLALNDITIKNGTVTASGNESSYGMCGESVTIENGNVTASGLKGIGANSQEGTGISISGGIVRAEGTGSQTDNFADAGISSVQGLMISGGTVTAPGNIGVFSHSGGITIDGGNVTATSSLAGLYAINLNIRGGKVVSDGTYGIAADENLSVSGGTTISSGTEGGIVAFGTVTIDESLIVKAGANEAEAEIIDDIGTWEHAENWVSIGHMHEFTYSASGNTITGICSADNCTLPLVDGSHTATLTITAPATGGAAVLEDDPAGEFGDLSNAVKYQTKTGSTWSEETITAPTAAGIHRATITLTGVDSQSATVSVSYGMNCITYATDLTNGSISGATGASCGATVSPTITPDEGYQLDTLTVTPEAGSDLSADDITVDRGTFVKPEANVTVSATFMEITHTVEVDGAIATVTDDTPEQNTYTAELINMPADKTYDGKTVSLTTATVQKSAGFPDSVSVGTVSLKDKSNSTVTTAKNVGTYTASATVGDQTVSKVFTIHGREPIPYVKSATMDGDAIVITIAVTDQYLLLESNPYGITLLMDGEIYVASG